MIEFKVPELGENVESADVSRVLVNVGDTIEQDQPVLELETDKATIEVPSSVAGVIKEVKVKKGEKVQVGAVVLTVEDTASGNGASATSKNAAPAVPPAKSAGPAAPAPAAAPAPPQVESPPDHKVLSMRQRAAAQPVDAPPPPPPQAPRSERGPVAPASPSVRRLAREIGVDVNEIQGTGPAGRISLDDVKEQARRILSSVGSAAAAQPPGVARAARALPDFQKWGEVERQPWSNIRRATAEHLSYAWNTIPHVTQFDKADITSLEELRRSTAAPSRRQAGT